MAGPSPWPRLNLDVSALLEPRWTGRSVFVRRLAEALIDSGEVDVEFVTRLARLPAPLVLEALRAGTGAYLRDALDPGEGLPLRPADLDAPTLYGSAKFGLGGLAKREASIAHDMTALFMPETCGEGEAAPHLDGRPSDLFADEAVFCVSAATRLALTEAAPSVASKTRLLPPYVDWPPAFELADRNLPRPALPPYALALGAFEPRGNLALLLAALEHPAIAGSRLRLVVAGRQGRTASDLLSDLAPRQRDRLIVVGEESEFARYRLLKHAEFLAFPALCEGDGVPALEAMSLGRPVLAARAGALPEVVGPAGVYFDPLSVEEFAAAFVEIADPRRRAELEPLALRQAADFTPERTTAPVLDWLEG